MILTALLLLRRERKCTVIFRDSDSDNEMKMIRNRMFPQSALLERPRFSHTISESEKYLVSQTFINMHHHPGVDP